MGCIATTKMWMEKRRPSDADDHNSACSHPGRFTVSRIDEAMFARRERYEWLSDVRDTSLPVRWSMHELQGGADSMPMALPQSACGKTKGPRYFATRSTPQEHISGRTRDRAQLRSSALVTALCVLKQCARCPHRRFRQQKTRAA